MEYLKEPVEEPFASYHAPAEVEETVSEILTAVRSGGDSKIREYTERFDDVSRRTNRLTDAERKDAVTRLTDEERRIIDNSTENIRQFAEAQMAHVSEFEVEMDEGITLGQKLLPIEKVGAYVPGGEYPLLSSALMAVVPAAVAGVETVVAAMPPQDDGLPHPAAVYGAHTAGADEIYVVGGAQAIAGMAYGTEEISKVDKIVGPGNIFVTEAKRQAFGEVGIDLLAGPSEILVLTDSTADPHLIAADLLAQAEHDRAARPLLVSTSESTCKAIIDEVESQLETLETASIAEQAWNDMGTVIVADDLTEAVELSNRLAPEHLEVHTETPRAILDDLTNYGTLFLGEYSANVFSDKLIGTNHILPTHRAARYTAGLSVHEFLKHPTYQEVTATGATNLEPWATRQSVIERLDGHAKSSFIRHGDRRVDDFDPDSTQLAEE